MTRMRRESNPRNRKEPEEKPLTVFERKKMRKMISKKPTLQQLQPPMLLLRLLDPLQLPAAAKHHLAPLSPHRPRAHCHARSSIHHRALQLPRALRLAPRRTLLPAFDRVVPLLLALVGGDRRGRVGAGARGYGCVRACGCGDARGAIDEGFVVALWEDGVGEEGLNCGERHVVYGDRGSWVGERGLGVSRGV